MIDLPISNDAARRLWDQYGDLVVLVAGAVLLLVLLALVVYLTRAARAGRGARLVAGYTFAASLFWMSQGQFEVFTADDGFNLPWYVALFGCAVFEGMLASAYLEAAEHRRVYGHPGPAGARMWTLALANGSVAALAAHAWSERSFRLVIPAAAVWAMWHALKAPRPTDTPEMVAAREKAARDRQATWAVTPRTLLVRLGLMRPGTITTTEAQREHQVARMVEAADTIAVGSRRAARRARRRLRQLTRTATPEMVAEVGRRQQQAAHAEALMVTTSSRPSGPADRSAPAPDDDGAALAARVRDQVAAARRRFADWFPAPLGVTRDANNSAPVTPPPAPTPVTSPAPAPTAPPSAAPSAPRPTRPEARRAARRQAKDTPKGSKSRTPASKVGVRMLVDAMRQGRDLPTAAEIDRAAGTNDYAKKVYRQWVEQAAAIVASEQARDLDQPAADVPAVEGGSDGAA